MFKKETLSKIVCASLNCAVHYKQVLADAIRIDIDMVNNLYIEIADDEIVITYHKEHEHFFAPDYKNAESMARHAMLFLQDIMDHTVVFENHYINNEMALYKVFILDDAAGKRLIKSVGTIRPLSGLFRKYKAEIKTETIRFLAQ